MPLTPEQRTLRARAAAQHRWSQEHPAQQASALRAGFMAKFYAQVDPDNLLPEAERERRAQSALKSHMSRLALASSRARGRRATS